MDAVEMHGVNGKVVIITGSGKGIGKGMALHLGKGGAQIVVADWKDELMAQTCAELSELGITNHGVVCDIQPARSDRRDGHANDRTLRSSRRVDQQRPDVSPVVAIAE